VTYRQSRREVDAYRLVLQRRFQTEGRFARRSGSAKLEPVARLLAARSQGAFEEVGADLLQADGRLARELERPLVYVRGQARDFKSPQAARQAAAESTRDAFVLCLLEPAESLKESVLLQKVGVVYRAASRGKMNERPYLLHDAWQALAFFSSDWSQKLDHMEHQTQLAAAEQVMAKELRHQGRRAASAELLLYVFDEAKDAGAPSDFDGESVHFMRVGLVELASMRPLLQVRRQVNPAWISEKRRLSFSRDLDSCRLAGELRGIKQSSML
jgi:hypothetical protein